MSDARIEISWGEAEENDPPFYMVALYKHDLVQEPDFITVDDTDNHNVDQPLIDAAIRDLCREHGEDAESITVEYDL